MAARRIAGAGGQCQHCPHSPVGLGPQYIFKIKVKDTEETAIVKDWLVDL